MLKLKSKQFVALVGDFLMAGAALFSALTLRFFDIPGNERVMVHVELFAPLFVFLVILYYSFDFYDFSPFQTRLRQFSRIINIHVFVALIGIGYFYTAGAYTGLTPKTVLVLYTIFHVVYAVMWRIFIMPQMLRPQARQNTLLLAEGDEYEELKHVVNQHSFYPFHFVEHIGSLPSDKEGQQDLLLKLKRLFEDGEMTQVVVDIRDNRTAPYLSYLYTLASQRKIHVFDAAMVYQDTLKKMPMRGVGHFWFFESVHLNIRTYEAAKRIVDIVIAIPWIIIWIILHPFVSLAIKLDSKGDIFIAQERYGFGGKVIKLYKYRTMTYSDKGMWLTEKDNPNKVTKVGYWLRKSRIDELPQLLSIMSGDLSLIGPRPDILALGGQLSATIPYYMMRYTVRPGLSGWAQVHQELPPQSLEETKVRLQYDLYYVKNRSLLLDFIILVKTFRVVVLRTGM